MRFLNLDLAERYIFSLLTDSKSRRCGFESAESALIVGYSGRRGLGENRFFDRAHPPA